MTNKTYGKFPAIRMRRMREHDFSRRLMRETSLSADDLIYPVFIIEGEKRRESVPAFAIIERSKNVIFHRLRHE